MTTLIPSATFGIALEWDEALHPRGEHGRFGTKVDDVGPDKGWHLTDDPHFVPDPEAKPAWNSIAGDIAGENRPKGIFVGDPEYWMHAHGYERPYMAEIQGKITNPPGAVMIKGREDFMQGDMRTTRVLTADEYARETYHEPGWVEEWDRPEGEPAPKIPKDYVGRPVSDMSPDEIASWEKRWKEYADRPEGPRGRQSVSASLIPSRALVCPILTIPSSALTMTVRSVPSWLISLEFDEALHPRDSHGRFGNKDSSAPSDTTPKSQGTTYVTRFGPDHPAGVGDSQITDHLVGQAKTFDGWPEPYKYAEDFTNYADVPRDDKTGEPLEPSKYWEPGSVYALSEAASEWQSSFVASAQMQRAADGLLGFPPGSNEYDLRDAACAREMLNAMAGNGPDGAASSYMISDENSMDMPTIGVRSYGSTELARGVDDPEGTLRASFQDALDHGTTVQWSMASFVQGGEGGQRRIDQIVNEMGDKAPTVFNPDTGDYTAQEPDDNAAQTALGYAKNDRSGTTGTAPMLIRTSGSALDLDGGWEAVSGGKFAVDDIHTATEAERAAWNALNSPPITVVQLHQTENVQLPAPVRIKVAA